MRHLSLLALAGVLAAGPLAAQDRDRYDWNGEIPAGATLRVATSAGNVNVTRAAGATARVHGQVRQLGDGARVRFEMVRDGRDVIVCALLSANARCTREGLRNDSYSGRRQPRADFTVELPAGVMMNASSGNGDVAVSGATVAVRATTGNGAVRVGAGAGEVHASTGNGSVLVEEARAAVRASSGNGRIEVASAGGPVSASSGNGDIQVSIASLRAPGDMAFSSGNGSITLRLPSSFGAEVDASTGSGSIRSDFDVRTSGRITRQRLRGTIGNGGRNLRVSTGNGRITLERVAGR